MHRQIRRTTPAVLVLATVSTFVICVQAGFSKGPYLQDVRTDGVTILWEQEGTSPGTVSIGGTSYPSTGQTMQRAVIDGIEPGTCREYGVVADGTQAGGGFCTAPADPLTPFTFVVVGDTRSGHEDHAQVVSAILAEGAIALVVNTGDLVGDGFEDGDWTHFFEIEDALMRNIVVYPTVGNHEAGDGEMPEQFTRYFAPPSGSSGSEAYYSFTYANTAFIVLDGHVNVDPILFGLWTDFDSAQKAWLESVLEGFAVDETIQHIFVFVHEPPFSSKDGRCGSRALRLLLPLFEQYGVDAVFTGHDHYLERGRAANGQRYFVMGGGGAPLYENENEGYVGPVASKVECFPWFDDAHEVDFAATSHGYMTVAVANGSVDVLIKDSWGEVLDADGWNTGDVPATDADSDGDADSDSDGGEGSDGDADTDGTGTDEGEEPDAMTPDEYADATGGCGCSAPGQRAGSPLVSVFRRGL